MKGAFSVILSVTISILFLRCGPALSEGKSGLSTGPRERTGGKGNASALATDDAQSPDGPYDAAPQTFRPRVRPSHSHPLYARPPELGSLPRLVDKLASCYPEYAENEIARPASGGAYRRKANAAPGKPARPSASAAGRSAASAPVEPSVAHAAPSAEMKAGRADMAGADREAAEPAQVATNEKGGERREAEEPKSDYHAWGAKIYLSNDDSMSLSSAQRVIFAIDNFAPLPLAHIRPHELLNYFSFETAEGRSENDFSVLADIAPKPTQEGLYTLALSVKGRPINRASRRNASITWVIDRSGSMEDEGKMEYLRQGLRRMVDELKSGDMVHMVLFDDEVCTPLENFVVGRDNLGLLVKAIDAIRPRNSTDLYQGLTLGYQIAYRAYHPRYSNRVIMITDAMANTGEVDEKTISMISKYYDARQIRLSGVGVGREFNDSLLDKLTERGKGAYVFLGSQAEVDAVFGSRFISLIETTAVDVHFQLHLPKSLRMKVFYGEESSTVKEDVQQIHYFANTSQLFLSDVEARGKQLRPQDDIMLTIEYRNPERNEERFEEYVFNLGEIGKEPYNVRKGRLLMAWIDMLAWMAARPLPPDYQRSAGTWNDDQSWDACEQGRQDLSALADGLEQDAEVKRVISLWDNYCSRYQRPRNPVRRAVSTQDSWPGAR